MTALWHDSGIPQGLCPTRIGYDYCEERIAELVEAKKTIVALCAGWWLYPQINTISNKYLARTRCGYSAHNWHIYMRPGWYWRNQNTGRMDTPRPPVRLAVDSMAMQGGNYSQRGEAESRRPHKPEIVGSNPTAATNVMPDRCGYAHQPVGSRPDLGKADAVSQMVVSQNMAPMQRVPNQISHDQAIGQQAPVRAFQWLL